MKRGEMNPSNTPWRKASKSGENGGNCVEVANLTPTIAVRDSKDPAGPKLTFTPAAWSAFTHRAKASEHDLT
jgi:Domain of unknown function (DUF397)